MRILSKLIFSLAVIGALFACGCSDSKRIPAESNFGIGYLPMEGEVLYFECVFTKPAGHINIKCSRPLTGEWRMYADNKPFFPNEGVVIGPLNGWNWQSGDIITIWSNGKYNLWRAEVPYASTNPWEPFVKAAYKYSSKRAKSQSASRPSSQSSSNAFNNTYLDSGLADAKRDLNRATKALEEQRTRYFEEDMKKAKKVLDE